jgi:hypothetical protein
VPWWIFVFVSSWSPADGSPVSGSCQCGGPVAGWRRGLETRQGSSLEIGAKAMEAAKSLDVQLPRGTPGVWGAERIEGGGGNWGGPPWPGSLRILAAGAWRPITGQPGSGLSAGWASEAAVVPVEPQDNTTCGDGKGAASSVCSVVRRGPRTADRPCNRGGPRCPAGRGGGPHRPRRNRA